MSEINLPKPVSTWGPIRLPLRNADREVYFQLWYYDFGGSHGRWALAMAGDPSDGKPMPLRIESACLFGHVFNSVQCDCGFQLDEAMARMAKLGRGIVAYGIDHDARGLGIETHFRIYVYRQTEKLDSEQVYERFNQPLDSRDYSPVAVMLRDVGAEKIELLSNNKRRLAFLQSHGFEVKTEPVEAPLSIYNMATLMLEKEDLQYGWSFKTHGDWLRPLQAKVEHDLDLHAAQVVVGTHDSVGEILDDHGWEVAERLQREVQVALATPAAEPHERVVYLTDFPRVDELEVYKKLGAFFVVVPFADIPEWLSSAAKAKGLRVQDWGREGNRYQGPRPQWNLVAHSSDLHVYARGDALRVVAVGETSKRGPLLRAVAQASLRVDGHQAALHVANRRWLEVGRGVQSLTERLRALGLGGLVELASVASSSAHHASEVRVSA